MQIKDRQDQSSTIFQAKMSSQIIFVCTIIILLPAMIICDTQQAPLRTCEKDEYSESKLLELLGVQSPMKDCVEVEKQELQSLIKDVFNSSTTFSSKNDTNSHAQTVRPLHLHENSTTEVNDMICSSPGNQNLKHMCCPVGQWPDKDGVCRSLF